MITPSGPRWTNEVRFIEEHLEDPLRWKRPRRIFVASMSDPFHPKVTDADRDKMLAIVCMAHWHTYQSLTKRPEAQLEYFSDPSLPARVQKAVDFISVNVEMRNIREEWRQIPELVFPLPNLWLGVSAEDQATFDARVPVLLRCPATVRWVSVEPMLGPVLLPPCLHGKLDWIVCGAESGPNRRPFDSWWAEKLFHHCRKAGIAFFMKQGSDFRSGKQGDVLDWLWNIKEYPE